MRLSWILAILVIGLAGVLQAQIEDGSNFEDDGFGSNRRMMSWQSRRRGATPRGVPTLLTWSRRRRQRVSRPPTRSDFRPQIIKLKRWMMLRKRQLAGLKKRLTIQQYRELQMKLLGPLKVKLALLQKLWRKRVQRLAQLRSKSRKIAGKLGQGMGKRKKKIRKLNRKEKQIKKEKMKIKKTEKKIVKTAKKVNERGWLMRKKQARKQKWKRIEDSALSERQWYKKLGNVPPMGARRLRVLRRQMSRMGRRGLIQRDGVVAPRSIITKIGNRIFPKTLEFSFGLGGFPWSERITRRGQVARSGNSRRGIHQPVQKRKPIKRLESAAPRKLTTWAEMMKEPKSDSRTKEQFWNPEEMLAMEKNPLDDLFRDIPPEANESWFDNWTLITGSPVTTTPAPTSEEKRIEEVEEKKDLGWLSLVETELGPIVGSIIGGDKTVEKRKEPEKETDETDGDKLESFLECTMDDLEFDILNESDTDDKEEVTEVSPDGAEGTDEEEEGGDGWEEDASEDDETEDSWEEETEPGDDEEDWMDVEDEEDDDDSDDSDEEDDDDSDDSDKGEDDEDDSDDDGSWEEEDEDDSSAGEDEVEDDADDTEDSDAGMSSWGSGRGGQGRRGGWGGRGMRGRWAGRRGGGRGRFSGRGNSGYKRGGGHRGWGQRQGGRGGSGGRFGRKFGRGRGDGERGGRRREMMRRYKMQGPGVTGPRSDSLVPDVEDWERGM